MAGSLFSALSSCTIDGVILAFSATMSPALVDFDELRRVSRLGERATLATVERWARKAGIRFQYDGRGGIWTTLEAMNAAVGIAPPSSVGAYSPDMVG